jgi:hypothetical protein
LRLERRPVASITSRAVLKGKIGDVKKLLYAENTDKLNSHAERNILKKVSASPHKPKRSVNLLVLRLSGTGVLGESRPCLHCIEAMERSRIKIAWVYYSTIDGTVVREKLTDMKSSRKTYISSRNRNMKWKSENSCCTMV